MKDDEDEGVERRERERIEKREKRKRGGMERWIKEKRARFLSVRDTLFLNDMYV